ncbi:hypothetical protein PIB30_020104 [Stylosanthes scabra]|uniref:Uncharacterized protein n=1 Tax=Stylosanthes scabra TaxID=79078 RepID=A0ABU6W6X6_9FABA|nr:hypothetical protein [Stylosanthes scabra]
MAEDAPAEQPTRKIRRMPKSYTHRRGAGIPRRGGRVGRGSGERGDTAPAKQTQGGASTNQADFLDGPSSLGFKQMISDIMLEGGSGYRPDTQFDGSQVHLDLNEPVFGPSHMFMASWWDSAISSTRAGWILRGAVHGACPFADSSSVTCTG